MSVSPDKEAYDQCRPDGEKGDDGLEREKHLVDQLRVQSIESPESSRSGRFRLDWRAGQNFCLSTSLLAVYLPPSCKPLSVRSFFAFRRKMTGALVSPSTYAASGK